MGMLMAIASFAFAADPAATHSNAPHDFYFGANVNESLDCLDPALLDRSHTVWVRGFLPASVFITGDRSVTNDPGIRTLQRCARAGRKVIVSLKWNFKEAGWRVPQPGSKTEQQCFDWVQALLVQMRGQISILSLANEVFIDTPPEDMEPDSTGHIPMVNFLQRLAEHVAAGQPKDPQGQPLPLAGGGFTRLDTTAMQSSPATLALLKWCETDPRIAVVDFHLHQRNYEQWQSALDFIRRQITRKPLIVTEFSMVWDYKAHLEDSLTNTPAGRQFVQHYSLNPSLTVRAYINQCISRPVSEAAWAAFVQSQAWLDPEFLDKVGDLMKQHGVMVATYALTQHSSGGYRPLRKGSDPWILNPIYIPNVAVGSNTNQIAVNLAWFREYVRRASN
jgi:hypothetical protein